MIRRRLIPPVLALAALVVALAPRWVGVLTERSANVFTLALMSATCVVLAGLFLWMRRRMGGESLTLFGTALRDLWLSLVVYFVVKAGFWGIFTYASWAVEPLGRREILVLRGAMDAAAALVVGTAFGVAWEMSRARTGPRMVVHVAADGGYDGIERRATGVPGRRATDRGA